jgi:hypothetical protein
MGTIVLKQARLDQSPLRVMLSAMGPAGTWSDPRSVDPVARLTSSFGALLVLLGLIAYFGMGRESITALIPAFFGVPLLVLGRLMNDPAKIKHAGHAAALLALLGLGGSFSGVPKTLTLLQGGEVERANAAVVQAVMAVLCLVFVVLAVKSFVDVRRRARAA